MGIDYTAKLVYGFEIDQKEVEGIWRRSEKDPGEFHMEDRFDSKTGVKIESAKVWDRKPSTKTWYEIEGKKMDYGFDIEEWERFLGDKLGCEVDACGSFPSNELTYVFHVNKPVHWKEADDYGKVTVFNSIIEHKDILVLMPKAVELKEKLEKLGLEVDEPSIFIAMRIS